LRQDFKEIGWRFIKLIICCVKKAGEIFGPSRK